MLIEASLCEVNAWAKNIGKLVHVPAIDLIAGLAVTEH
jgi:hypothetical protein